jgi:hypothetical protein
VDLDWAEGGHQQKTFQDVQAVRDSSLPFVEGDIGLSPRHQPPAMPTTTSLCSPSDRSPATVAAILCQATLGGSPTGGGGSLSCGLPRASLPRCRAPSWAPPVSGGPSRFSGSCRRWPGPASPRAISTLAAAQCPGVSAPRSRSPPLARACAAPAIGGRVGSDAKLTSEWTNPWGQASSAAPGNAVARGMAGGGDRIHQVPAVELSQKGDPHGPPTRGAAMGQRARGDGT